ncbi:YetF domain-containing protein [Aquibacillus kalidii]|uniref:YetF domain-containing protein n=1 Tax=Aquibacillus kalidii TaxID=2762597 RepID=UPI001644623F|nr:DUF421 domain-containing protein [Aquibacillus kalidii]
MELYNLVLRIVLSFGVLLALTRIMGRKELSQLTFFNFVSGISIGSIGAMLTVNSTLSIRNGVIALVGWSLLTIVMGYLDIKSKTARKAIVGQPMILIKNGEIMESEMRKARLDIDALNSMLRQKNVFSLKDVQYGILETDGKLSVMKKDYKQNATRADIGAQTASPSNQFDISTKVISDGNIETKNLKKLNLDENWLNEKLSEAGIDDASDVFYAEVQKDGSLYIDSKDDVVH